MDPNYRRRSQNEDEFMLFVLPTIEDSSQPSCSKNPIHTSKLSGAERVHEILTGHVSLSKRNFRMEAGIFQALVNKLREKQLLDDSRISVQEKVAIFLYALAKNASNETLQYEFQHSGETISRHFGAVLDAITQLTCVYIRPPSLHPHQILRRPKFHPFFQDCVGFIDGTHIPMILPLDQQEPYRNRKQTISQNVMLACDLDLKFVHVHTGWEGPASDARVLHDALKHGFEVPPGKFYLVDAGYANTPQFLAPYRGTRYHLQEQGRANQIFNTTLQPPDARNSPAKPVGSATCCCASGLLAATIPHPQILLFHGYNLLVARLSGGPRATASGVARRRRRVAGWGCGERRGGSSCVGVSALGMPCGLI